ncbi:MAG: hypothetical protein Q8P67_17535, partial [archaeon]|nr:hypothetical protein [archaeon]
MASNSSRSTEGSSLPMIDPATGAPVPRRQRTTSQRERKEIREKEKIETNELRQDAGVFHERQGVRGHQQPLHLQEL